MAPRKRRGVGRMNGLSSITVPPTSTHAVNTHGFAALADEIYLEIVSHIPSVPIPTSTHLESYPEIRRSRHETFLSRKLPVRFVGSSGDTYGSVSKFARE